MRRSVPRVGGDRSADRPATGRGGRRYPRDSLRSSRSLGRGRSSSARSSTSSTPGAVGRATSVGPSTSVDCATTRAGCATDFAPRRTDCRGSRASWPRSTWRRVSGASAHTGHDQPSGERARRVLIDDAVLVSACFRHESRGGRPPARLDRRAFPPPDSVRPSRHRRTCSCRGGGRSRRWCRRTCPARRCA